MSRVLVGLALVAVAAGTGRAEPLTLGEVVVALDRALPALRAVRQDQALADAELRAARGAFDPVLRTRFAATPYGYYETYRFDAVIEQPIPHTGLTAQAGYRLGRGDFAVYDGKLETNDYGEVRVGVSASLLRNGWTDRRRTDIARAELGRPLADLSVRQARIEATRVASARYWDWVAAGRRLAVAEALLALAEARDAALVERAARGDIAAIDRTDNQRTILQRRAAVHAAERALEQSALELSLFYRDAEARPIIVGRERLPGELPPVDDALPSALDDAARRAARERPELRRYALLGQQLELERRLARNQLFPALDVGVALSQDFGPGSPTRKRLEVDLFAVLDVPLTFRTGRARLAAAEASLRRLGELARAQADRAATDVRDAASAILQARQRARTLRDEVALARQLEEAERTRYALGDSNLIYVNLREQTSAEAEARYIDALADYHRGRAAWEAATAR